MKYNMNSEELRKLNKIKLIATHNTQQNGYYDGQQHTKVKINQF